MTDLDLNKEYESFQGLEWAYTSSAWESIKEVFWVQSLSSISRKLFGLAPQFVKKNVNCGNRYACTMEVYGARHQEKC